MKFPKHKGKCDYDKFRSFKALKWKSSSKMYFMRRPLTVKGNDIGSSENVYIYIFLKINAYLANAFSEEFFKKYS